MTVIRGEMTLCLAEQVGSIGTLPPKCEMPDFGDIVLLSKFV